MNNTLLDVSIHAPREGSDHRSNYTVFEQLRAHYDVIEDETWIVAMNTEIDDQFATPDYVGWLDAQLGLPCEPLEYYAKLGDIEAYIIGWKEAQETINVISE